jgi:hypothetical protein
VVVPLSCRPSWSLAGVVLVIAAGLLLLVAGETRFDLVGFLVVMGASMLAGFRWTITQVLLQGDAKGHTSAQHPLLATVAKSLLYSMPTPHSGRVPVNIANVGSGSSLLSWIDHCAQVPVARSRCCIT